MSSAALTPERSCSVESFSISGPESPAILADLFRGTGPDAVMVVPGFWRTRADPVMRRISSHLNRAGLTVLTLDNRGHGDSGGVFGFNTFESEDTVRALEAAVEKGLVPGKLCLMGFSAGGAIALSTAARRPDLVAGLLLISPVADFKRVFPRPNPLRIGRQLSLRAAVRPPRFWWFERSRRHVLDDARTVEVPVCLIHAYGDWLVHHSHSERIARNLPSGAELHICDLDQAHAERLFDTERAPWELVFTFMTRSLGMRLSAT